MNVAAVTLPQPFLRRLKHIVGAGNCRTDPADCWAYGYDNSKRHALPQAVAFAAEHDQVRELAGLCHEFEVPLVARGRGTGTTGATTPIQGGLVLSLERMDRLLEFSPDNRYAVAQPGMTNEALQQAVGRAGFFWPPDPTSSAFCSIGGNLACNAAGPARSNTARRGTTP
ncbi:FAD-binding oxidoreductase [Methylogaea oryzae]|uniref:FAD-binding oxidoreductase n=1 Tax=Methylogaea oryzae TaxID=1295382 RepID=UPI000AD462F3|nr:FAD-binding oxidoreductase [Methylogaea oryzae]